MAESLLLFLEEVVERCPGVAGRGGRSDVLHRHIVGRGRSIASDGHARPEKSALIRLVFARNPRRNRFETLESRGGLKMSALLATVQGCVTFRTVPLKVHSGREGCGAVVTPCGDNGLHQTRQTRSGDVKRRTRPRLPGAIVAASHAVKISAGILVPRCPVLSLVIHGRFLTP
jgi:hypothetical protein